MITDLTGMSIANASLLDEGTAAAEAMTLCQRSVEEQGEVPSSSPTTATRRPSTWCARAPSRSASRWWSATRAEGPPERAPSACCCSTRAPTATCATTARIAAAAVHAGALVIVAADLLALTLLTPPGEWGADVAVGSRSASACRWASAARTPATWPRATSTSAHARPPGRRVVDAHGRTGLPPGAADARAAHPPREGHQQHLHRAGAARGHGQHVRRLPRPGRAARIAERVHRLTAIARRRPAPLGFDVATTAFFDTITVDTGPTPPPVHAARALRASTCAHIDAGTVGISLDETTTRDDVEALWAAFGGVARTSMGRCPRCRDPTRMPAAQLRRAPS
jgi:glycine dehydrogenase